MKMYVVLVVAIFVAGIVGLIVGFAAGHESVRKADTAEPRLARAYANVQPVSEIVDPVLAHPDVGFGEYFAIDWLRSRVHFREPNGTTIVGHDMLVSAVNQVNEMHAAMLECRGPGAPVAIARVP